MKAELVRLRADPKKIRVSIRRAGNLWRVVVRSLITDSMTSAGNQDPGVALRYALEAASRLGDDFEGLDLDMQWAYEHPQGKHS